MPRRRKGRIKIQEARPAINSSDQKILWARAAGRCSICRDKLTLDRNKEPTVTLGEICHIVGEKRSAARGNQGLEMKLRGKYSNLILLCPNDHTLIDKHETKYTVALLHEIKAKHENWVEDKLAVTRNPADAIYADVIDTIAAELPLDRWRHFVDHALRLMVKPELVDARGTLNDMMMRTIWPRKYPSLKKAVGRMVQSFDDWITMYSANADMLAHPVYLRPIVWWRNKPPEVEMRGRKEERLWANACYALLAHFVARLNVFAVTVRKTINPLFRLREGKFLLYDDLGYWNQNRPNIIEPIVSVSSKLVAKHVPRAQFILQSA